MNEITTAPEAEVSTALTASPTAALALVRQNVSTVLAADTTDILGRLKAEIDGFEGDVSTKKGREEIASKAYKVAVAKADLVRLAEGLKTDAQKIIKTTNAEVKVITENMDALRDRVRQPLDDFENAETARVAAHEAALKEIEVLALVQGLSADMIKAQMWNVPAVDARHWQEFTERAERVTQNTLDRLRIAHIDAEEAEARWATEARLKAAETARLALEAEAKRLEREAQIAADARAEAERAAEAKLMEAEARAGQARRDADRAIVEARERAERAERAATEEAAAATARAAARIEADNRKAEDEALARAANLENVTRVHRAALADIIIALSPVVPPAMVDAAAKRVVTAIARGAVRAVSIQY